MSGEYPLPSKIVSPAKCNEKPWDLWIGEIGHLSPRADDDGAFVAPAPAESKCSGSRRMDAALKRGSRYRRAGLHRLRHDTMSLHGLFPQMDNLNAAVCHMCGVVVKCSAAYRHLVESHADSDALLPPPPSTATIRSRSRHKKEPPPPPPVDIIPPVKMDTSPVHTVPAPVSRLVLPAQELYLEEAGGAAPEVKVCVESGDLPVVSIQDPDDLPLGENLTDDIFAIMNSEGIQSADDIANSADWKNIIRDIGNLQDLNFSQPADGVPSSDLYAPALHTPMTSYAISDAELANLQFAATTPPPLPAVVDTTAINAQALKPATPTAPTAKQSRSKSTKTKFNLREYDPNKHCGVVTAENNKPCTRSLTCKAHALSLRRTVEGRAKPFDTLLAEHRASREAASAPAVPAPAPAPAPAPLPPLLVNTAIDLSAFNGLTAEQQVDDIYALLGVDSTGAMLPDTSGITSLLNQSLPSEPFLLPSDAEPPPAPAPPPPVATVSPARARREPGEEAPAVPLPTDVCWYSSCPRPLALCTFNASHAGGAVTLGKRYATVRSNIKSSLSRQKSAGATNSLYYGQNALALSKSVHMNSSKSNRPEVRKLIVTCSDSATEVHRTLAELFSPGPAVNGHVSGGKARAGHSRPHKAPLELGFALDPLLADEKC